MVKISREEIIKLSQISHLKLNENEIQPLENQLNQVLTYAASVTKIPALTHEIVNKNTNIFREDVVVTSSNNSASELVCLAPEYAESYFVVPIILDSNDNSEEKI